mmetsp:Transcript_14062/g.52759  ORF Transcript_14062/g.52759 Transcript_14062/m.52759 type:complete len:364 (-) Transcript_14062:2-1093(-)
MLLFISEDSWFPRTSQTLLGYRAFKARRTTTVSSWCRPRSTQSPLKTYWAISMSPVRWHGIPNSRNRSRRSRSWPWMSPKTFAGAWACTTVGCALNSMAAALSRSVSWRLRFSESFASRPKSVCSREPVQRLSGTSRTSLPTAAVSAAAVSMMCSTMAKVSVPSSRCLMMCMSPLSPLPVFSGGQNSFSRWKSALKALGCDLAMSVEVACLQPLSPTCTSTMRGHRYTLRTCSRGGPGKPQSSPSAFTSVGDKSLASSWDSATPKLGPSSRRRLDARLRRSHIGSCGPDALWPRQDQKLMHFSSAATAKSSPRTAPKHAQRNESLGSRLGASTWSEGLGARRRERIWAPRSVKAEQEAPWRGI